MKVLFVSEKGVNLDAAIRLYWDDVEVDHLAPGEGAMAAILRERPDVVLLDLQARHGTRVDTVKAIRRISDVPIIALYEPGDEMAESVASNLALMTA